MVIDIEQTFHTPLPFWGVQQQKRSEHLNHQSSRNFGTGAVYATYFRTWQASAFLECAQGPRTCVLFSSTLLQLLWRNSEFEVEIST
jgi:hypothetical protein